ncbi:MAG: PAS domain S-box protein [Bacteroidetes bacterium]|nr:PAS domain S-box protein [Bacteroidota bacterium]
MHSRNSLSRGLVEENKKLKQKISELESQLSSIQDNRSISIGDSQRRPYPFELIADSIPAFIAYVDTKELKYRFVNIKFEMSFGIPKKEIVGKHIADLIGKDNYNFALKYIEEVKKGNPTSYINTFNLKEGKRWAKVNYVPDFDSKGNVQGIILLTYDITEIKQAEEQLKIHEHDLLESQKIAQLGSYIFNAKTGNWTSSVILDGILGLEKDCVKDVNTWIQLLHPENRDSMSKYFTENILANHEVFNKEYRIIRVNDGEERWIHGRGKLEIDKDGNVVSMIGTIQDITERVKVTEALKRSENKYKDIIEFAVDGILLGSPEGYITGANSYMQKLTGRSKEEIIGLHIMDLFNDEDLNRVPFRFDLLKKGQIVISERNILSNDGKLIPIEMHTKMMNDGTYQSIFHDVSERKRTEEEKRISERRMRLIVEGTPNLFFYTQNRKALVTYISPSVEKITGHPVSEWINQSHWFITDSEINKKAIKNTHAHLNGHYSKEPAMVEVTHADGRPILLEVYENPMIIEGEVVGLQGVAHDITQKKLATDRLRENEMYLTKAEKIAKFGNWMLQLDKKIVQASEGAKEIYGTHSDELNYETIKEFALPDYRDYLNKCLVDLVHKGIPYNVEFKIKRKCDGEIRDIRSIAEYNSKTRIVFGVIKDITEQKNAEEQLRDREDFLEALVENIPNMIFVKDTKELKFIRFNKAGEELLGYSRDELIGKSDYDFFNKEEADYFTGKDREVLANKTSVNILEENITTKHKGNRILYTRKIPILDNNGNPQYLLGISEDITERKKSEEQLKMLAKALTTVNECVCMTNLNDELIFVNTSFQKTYGYSEEELLGQTMSFVRSDKNPIEVIEQINPATRRGGWNGVLWNKRKDGSEFPIQISTAVIKDDNKNIIAFVGVGQDITEQLQKEKELIETKEIAEKSNKLKSEFLAQMSHEIRTPISTILNFTNLIKYQVGDIVNEELQEGFSIIDAASQRVIRTIDMILNMSEIQTGTYEFKASDIDLEKDIVDNIANEFSGVARSRGLKLQVIKKTENTKILGDEYSVMQIFANLIDNALKYTDTGKVEIILSELKNSISVKVKDTGVGISNEYLPLIFEPFSQEEQGYTRRFEGNGLGLALVKEYCKMNNATISVKSIKSEGTTFTVLFKKHI